MNQMSQTLEQQMDAIPEPNYFEYQLGLQAAFFMVIFPLYHVVKVVIYGI